MGNGQTYEVKKQDTPVLEQLFKAFQTDNAKNALDILELVKNSFHKDSVFRGWMRFNIGVEFNGQYYGRGQYEKTNIPNLFKLIIKGIHKKINIKKLICPTEESSIANHLYTIYPTQENYSDVMFNVDGMKPVWLAYLLSQFDWLLDTKWTLVFNNLVTMNNPTLDDTIMTINQKKPFKITADMLIFNPYRMDIPNYYSNPMSPIKKINGREYFGYNDAYKTIIINTESKISKYSSEKSNVIRHLIIRDQYELLKDVLSFGKGINELLNDKQNDYLHVIQNHIACSNQIKYLELLLIKTQATHLLTVKSEIQLYDPEEKLNLYAFQLAYKRRQFDSLYWYFKNFNIIEHFSEKSGFADILCELMNSIVNKDFIKTVVDQAVQMKVTDIFKHKSVTKDLQTPLHLACNRNPDEYNILCILEAAKKLDILKEIMDMQDKHGDTPLHVLCLYRTSDSAYEYCIWMSDTNIEKIIDKYLTIAKEAKINITNQIGNYGRTVFSYVCMNNNYNVFLKLVEFSKNFDDHKQIINKPDKGGDTIAHYAFTGGDKKLIETLINMGIEIDKPNNSGETPYMVAFTNNRFEFLKSIQHIADNYNKTQQEPNVVKITYI